MFRNVLEAVILWKNAFPTKVHFGQKVSQEMSSIFNAKTISTLNGR